MVYLFTCAKNKNVNYVGRTLRRLNIRIKEHISQVSPIGQHLLNCDECVKTNLIENFRILAEAKNINELNYLEATFIKKIKPSLNTALSCNFADTLILV